MSAVSVLAEISSPALRGVLIGAIMMLVGGPPTLQYVVRPELDRHGLKTARMDRFASMTVGAAIVGAVLAASALAVSTVEASGARSLVGWVSATPDGRAWLALVVVAGFLGVLTAGRRFLSPRRWLDAVFVGGLAMLLAFCWTRYSVAVDSPAVAIVAKFGHMTGAALWVGGLAVLAAFPALLASEPDEATVAPLIRSIIRRFSMIAVVGVTVAFATGIAIAAWHVPTLSALVSTPYGLLLSAKVGLVSLAAAIGGFNRVVVHERIAPSADEPRSTAAIPGLLAVAKPRITPSDAISAVTRSVRLELAVLVVAVALSVVLTTMTPSYELFGATVAASSQFVAGAAVGFATLLKTSAVTIALVGSLALGYELGASDLVG